MHAAVRGALDRRAEHEVRGGAGLREHGEVVRTGEGLLHLLYHVLAEKLGRVPHELLGERGVVVGVGHAAQELNGRGAAEGMRDILAHGRHALLEAAAHLGGLRAQRAEHVRGIGDHVRGAAGLDLAERGHAHLRGIELTGDVILNALIDMAGDIDGVDAHVRRGAMGAAALNLDVDVVDG